MRARTKIEARGNQRGRLKDCWTSPGLDGSPGVPHKGGPFFYSPVLSVLLNPPPHAQPFTDKTPRPIGLINPTHYTLDVHQWGEVREEEDETYNEAEAGPRALVCFVEVLEEL